MLDAKVTSKGQMTIPKAVRDQLGLQPGDEVEFVPDNGGYRICRDEQAAEPSTEPEDRFGPWVGAWKHLAGRTTEEIMRELRGYDAEDDRILAAMRAGDAGQRERSSRNAAGA